ncbi:hypothetical protein GALL_339370 [mine drainage metagenome]|uniref:Uncharacterized protein n=1 Tax=mine drainage metagenome TaxID=410659 RepID=A0A1J5QL64_9ZZZZ
MLKAIRLIVLVITPLIFCAAWYIAPSLLGAEALRFLSGLVVILWGLEFYFFRKLGEVSAVQGITSREHERLVIKLSLLRKRIWWVGGIGLICSVIIWMLATLGLPATSPIYASMVGVLVGISLSYLILLPGWFNESQEFIDEVRRLEASKKKLADIAKLLGTDLK